MYRPDLRLVKDTVPEEPEGIQHYVRKPRAAITFHVQISRSLVTFHASRSRFTFKFQAHIHVSNSLFTIHTWIFSFVISHPSVNFSP